MRFVQVTRLDSVVASMQQSWLPNEVDKGEVQRLLSGFRQRDAVSIAAPTSFSADEPEEQLLKVCFPWPCIVAWSSLLIYTMKFFIAHNYVLMTEVLA